MSDLADFLLQRIAEDEDRAQGDIEHFGGTADPRDQWIVKLAHGRLAESAAKRGIVEAFVEEVPDGKLAFWEDEGRGEALAFACRALASVYAGHPEFREEWR